jgi:hypothetical protein
VTIARRSWLRGLDLARAGCTSSTLPSLISAIAIVLGLSACSTGTTKIDQKYFLAVPSNTNVNYFRVRVRGESILSVTDFRSGWFPADAVDSLYGDVSQNGATEAFRVKEQLKAKYNAAILKAQDGYLAAASDPKTDPAVLQSWILAEHRVRATAGSEAPLPAGAVEVEYDPGRGITTAHAGEKLVLVLSSDPTSVIEAISAFSNDVQTGATVLNLADVMRQQSSNDVATTEARNAAKAKTDALIAQRLGALSDLLKTDPKRPDLVREIESLRMLLETYR